MVALLIVASLLLATPHAANARKTPPPHARLLRQNAEQARYTGLVVQTPGIRLTGGTLLRVADESGRIVLECQVAQSSLAFSLPDALAKPQLGPRPLVVQSVARPGVTGSPPEILLSNENANRIFRENKTSRFLGPARVVFVVDPPPAETVLPDLGQTKKPGFSDEALAGLRRNLGIPKEEWKLISANRELLGKLETLSPDALRLYKGMSYFEKIKFGDEMRGKTTVFFFTIDNKEAFVTGKAMGHDVFKHMVSGAEEAYRNGKITRDEYERKSQALEIASRLAEQERRTLVWLLETELKARNPDRTADQ